MHKISVHLDGVVSDAASVELDDAAAFILFVSLKRALLEGAPARRKARRSGAPATPDGAVEADGSAESDAEA